MIGSILRRMLDRFVLSSPSRAERLLQHVDSKRFDITLMMLARKGLRFDTIYDIGAHHGNWTRSARDLFPNSKFVMFEANKVHEPCLSKVGAAYFIGVLSNGEHNVEFYGDGGSGDSYYRENRTRYENLKPEVLKAATLDSIITRNALPLPDFLKLDTQGSELDILSGAGTCLEVCSLVLLECPTVPYNVGAPKLSDYLDFMRERGFVPLELSEIHYKAQMLVQIDLIFLRDTEYRRLFGEGELALMRSDLASTKRVSPTMP